MMTLVVPRSLPSTYTSRGLITVTSAIIGLPTEIRSIGSGSRSSEALPSLSSRLGPIAACVSTTGVLLCTGAVGCSSTAATDRVTEAAGVLAFAFDFAWAASRAVVGFAIGADSAHALHAPVAMQTRPVRVSRVVMRATLRFDFIFAFPVWNDEQRRLELYRPLLHALDDFDGVFDHDHG